MIKIVLDMLDGPNKDGQRFRYSQEVRLRTVVSFKIKTKLVFVVAKLRWLGRTKIGSLGFLCKVCSQFGTFVLIF